MRVGRHIAVAATAAIWPDGEVLGSVRPATGFIVVGGVLDPHWRVEIEADAIVDDLSHVRFDSTPAGIRVRLAEVGAG